MKPKLTLADFQAAAKKLRCEVAAIRAVAEVESRGEGFYADGFPVILFERHKFRSFTNGRYNNSHPHLSGPAGGYGKPGQNQQNKFNEAFALDPVAAMKSCSWGKFQIMGFNHAACGFATVGEFVDAMKESEGAQLLAFVNFVINNGLADELRNLEWAGFARGYNGADYRKNKYDTKMAKFYAKFKKDSGAVPSTTDPILESKEPAASAETAQSVSAGMNSSQPPIPETVEVDQIVAQKDEPKQEDFITRMSNRFVAIPGMVLTALGAAVTWATSAPLNLILVLAGASVLIALVYMTTTSIRNAGKEKREMEMKKIREAQAFELQKLMLLAAADPNQNTVKIAQPPPVTEILNSDAPEEAK